MMVLLSVCETSARLACDECGAHRKLSLRAYDFALKRGAAIRCDTCARLSGVGPARPQSSVHAPAGR